MKKNGSATENLLTLGVFALFSLCVLLVLLGGARVYRGVVRRGEEGFQKRTAAQYVVTRFRQASETDVTDFEGCPALTVRETVDGAVYLTRLYCYGGYLRELYCPEGARLSPADGEKLLPADSLVLEIAGNLLTARLDGQQICLYLPGKEALP